jgi:hypothetical protein
MIIGKQFTVDPNYYQQWDDFKKAFPTEASIIFAEFDKICKASTVIEGKYTVKDILNNFIPAKFPKLNEDFTTTFPNNNIAAVLGIGLWKVLDKDTAKWEWDEISGVKRYTRK